MKSNILFVTALCIVIIFGACSDWVDSINFGSSGADGKTSIGDEGLDFLESSHYLDDYLDDSEDGGLEYTITYTNGTDVRTETTKGKNSFEVYPGVWDIRVEAKGDRIKGYWKTTGARINAGTRLELNIEDMILTSTRVHKFEDFKTDFDNLNDDKLKGLEYIEIAEDFTLDSFLDVKKNIELRSEKDVTIDRTFIDGTGSNALFNIKDGGTLTLDGRYGKIEINGGKDGIGSGSKNAIINVHKGGTLIMLDGVTLKNNITTGGYGGGVWIGGPGGTGNPGGTFIMKGGEISGNTASATGQGQGGGVYLNHGGIFEMEGGTISGNSATNNGGGVYVGNSTVTGGSFAKFTKTGGTITDSNTVNNIASVVYEMGMSGTPYTQTLGPNDNWPRP